MLKRFRIGIKIELHEVDLSMVHPHRFIGRVLEFDDSKDAAFRAYDRLEAEILAFLARKENQP